MAISIHGPQGKLIIKALRYSYKAIEDLHCNNNMRTSILNTISLIAASDAYLEQGIKDYIYPILSEIQETQIPERLTLISINHEKQGFHLWSFTIKDPDTLTQEEYLEISNQLHQVFPFDSEASLEMPLIPIWSTLVMVTVPFTC